MTRPSEIKPRDVDQPGAPFSVVEVGSTLPETRFSLTQEIHELVNRVEVWTAPAKVCPPCSTSLAGSTSAAFADDEPRGDIERRQLDLRKEDHGREAGLEAPPGRRVQVGGGSCESLPIHRSRGCGEQTGPGPRGANAEADRHSVDVGRIDSPT